MNIFVTGYGIFRHNIKVTWHLLVEYIGIPEGMKWSGGIC